MKKDDSIYLKHILDAIIQINEYLHGITVDQFMATKMLQDAVVRQLEIVGEASRNLSEIYRDQHNEVPWGQIAGMRNRIAHDYISVDMDIIWDIVEQDLPPLQEQVVRLLTIPD